ncbi:cell wall metabolism sensor histidine kinase WalK [uncultured Eubacterium sp.]|uniref:sensor histidine kinase n=1 Tax=uncultured Eubacterium sp. TaxID=165185 RepID=UPI002671DC8A|nr:HAMP domain-containing sensor histidine kinase [uncultured Eubacterium sp.]
MKLRTRIIWISSITVLLSALLCVIIIGIFMYRSLREEAFIKAYQESMEVTDKVKTDMEKRQITYNNLVSLNYIFKMYGDNYNVCYTLKYPEKYIGEKGLTQKDVNEVFNNTIFSFEKLTILDYKEISLNDRKNVQDNPGILYSSLHYEGRNYTIFRVVIDDAMLLYKIHDVTYVQEKMLKLMTLMIGITFFILFMAVLILRLILKKELRPLQELNENAKNIAEGFYHQRIVVNRKDEVGQLGENFNKMAEAVEVRTNRLRESEQRKTIFMGDLTHELKTPMTAISGYAQTLLSARISDEDREEALTYIIEQCRRLERLSRKMTNLLELGQNAELELEEVAIKKLFSSAAMSCEMILKNKKIALQIVEQGEYFIVDFDLMTDVLINLLDNAVKASEEGAKIVLRATDRCIEVQDFGRGIPKDEQNKILEPFYMVDKSRSRKNGGAGLGLALVSLILEKHNIKMSIVSELGEGSRFILKFPE